MEDDAEGAGKTSSGEKKDTALKILQTAQDNDYEQISKFFEKQNEFEKSEIEKEMDRLKNEIESLEEVTS
jgi:hypothetical protein